MNTSAPLPRPVDSRPPRLLTPKDVEAARHALSGTVLRTPLLAAPVPGRPLWLKAENLQLTGSFKIRGAHHRLANADRTERARGVVAHSSGNHAQAVAHAARRLGIPATIVMPDTAIRLKIEATRALGAEVVTAPADAYRRTAEELAADRGTTVVSPFDDLLVMAGQGTVGLEIAEDLPAHRPGSAGEPTLLVPVGSGGLIAGVAVAAKSAIPGCRVVGVEPELAADAAESLRRGRRTGWTAARTGRTVADGLRTPVLGELTWEHIRRHVDAILTVTEDEIRAAVAFLAGRTHLVAEPSGAVATAAFLHHSDRLPGTGPCVAVVSGGNVHPADLGALLTEPVPPAPGPASDSPR
ncbi:threonine/serine dehydratase [Kitasatospora sp. NPDC005856]|uniref:threonine ammonia-lyase n=1 Tax=Kitasatospora sp. NPDC005856 TaxID=3154566 RepID=UPI0033DAB08D